MEVLLKHRLDNGEKPHHETSKTSYMLLRGSSVLGHVGTSPTTGSASLQLTCFQHHTPQAGLHFTGTSCQSQQRSRAQGTGDRCSKPGLCFLEGLGHSRGSQLSPRGSGGPQHQSLRLWDKATASLQSSAGPGSRWTALELSTGTDHPGHPAYTEAKEEQASVSRGTHSVLGACAVP